MLKIQEIFDSKRGKKKVKLLSPAGREAAPVKGTGVCSTTVCALNTSSGTIPLPLAWHHQLKEHLPNPNLTLPQGEDSEPGLKVLFQKKQIKAKIPQKTTWHGSYQ